MTRSRQVSPVPEIGTPGLRWRGLETGPWRPYTGTKLETADTAKGSLPVPRQSSTLLLKLFAYEPAPGVTGLRLVVPVLLGRPVGFLGRR